MAEKKKDEKPLSLEDKRAKACGLEPGQVYTARSCDGLSLPKTQYRNHVRPGDQFDAEGRELALYAGRVEIKVGSRWKRVESEEARKQMAESRVLKKRVQARAIDNFADRLHRQLQAPDIHRALPGVKGRPPEYVQRLRDYCDAAEKAYEPPEVEPKASNE